MGLSRSFWGGKRVFLTGHTGFKGSWLALWLERLGAQVTGFANGVPTVPSLFEAARVGEALQSVDGDVRDLGRLRDAVARARPQIVIHLAAQSLVQRSLHDPELTYSTNVLGTVHVHEAVREIEDVRVLLNVTSDKCYRNTGAGRPYREDDPLGGRDPYSSSKACAELVSESYRASVFGNDVGVATARAGNVIGGGDWAPDRLVPDVMAAAIERRPALLRNPRSLRPWQHVLNPLLGYLLLVERLWDDADAGSAWNFGPDEVDVRPVRWVAEELASRWDGGIDFEEGEQGNAAEASVLRLDSTKARTQLGWRPAWNLEAALDRVAAWYAAFGAGKDMRRVTLAELDAYGEAAERVPSPGVGA